MSFLIICGRYQKRTRIYLLRKAALIFCVLFFVVGCGGSGSEATDSNGSGAPVDDSADGNDNDTDAGNDNDTDAGNEGQEGSDGGNGGGNDGGVGDEQDALTLSFDVLYAQGAEAPGLSDGQFSDILAADVSHAGDSVCFVADYSDAGLRKNGVWCGAPGFISLVVATGNQIDNLPSNIQFKSATSVEFADDGRVAIVAKLQGASDGDAVLLWDGASVDSILRAGELAPGLSDGSSVGNILSVDISTDGAAIFGSYGVFGQFALWYWDGDDFSLITSLLNEDNKTDQNGCVVGPNLIGGLGLAVINNSGTIAFQALLSSGADTTDTSLCRGSAIVTYRDGDITTLVKTGDSVASAGTARYTSFVVNRLFDSGTIYFSAVVEDDNASGFDVGRWSQWFMFPDGSANLVSIVEETVPPAFEDKISLTGQLAVVIAEEETRAVQLVQTSLGKSLLSGPAHQGMPYEDISVVGATNMSLIASSNSDSPVGFPADTFISDFSRPSIDTDGLVYYLAQVERPGEREVIDAFYTARADQMSQLVVKTGDSVSYNGQARTITSINLDNAVGSVFATIMSPGVIISNRGHALLPVSLDGIGEALLFVDRN